MFICQYCAEELDDRYNFCSQCRHQVKCVSCGKELERDTDMCLVCGQESVRQKPANEFTLEERHTSKSSFRRVHAILTDSAFDKAAEVFIGVTGGQIYPRVPQPSRSEEQPAIEVSIDGEGASDAPSDKIQGQLPLVDTSTEQGEENGQSAKADASKWFRQANNELFPKTPDFKGVNKKTQQQRFIVMCVWAYRELIDSSGPTREQVYKVARTISLYDQNTSGYFSSTAHEYLLEIDNKFDLKPQGEKFADVILAELEDETKEGFDYSKSGGVKAKRNIMSEEDRQAVGAWVHQPIELKDFDITSLDSAGKAASFALWCITEKLKVAKAVKSRMAHTYLMEKYETISVKYDAFRKVLSNKSYAKRFQANEDKAYYLTSFAKKEVEGWIAKGTASKQAE